MLQKMHARSTCTRTCSLHQDMGTHTVTSPSRGQARLGVAGRAAGVHDSAQVAGRRRRRGRRRGRARLQERRPRMRCDARLAARLGAPGRTRSLSHDLVSKGPAGARQALVAVLKRRQDLASQTWDWLSASRLCSCGGRRVPRLLERGVLGRAGAPVHDGAQLPALQLRQRLGERGQLVGRRKQRARLRVCDDEVDRILAQRVVQRHAEVRLPVARLRARAPPSFIFKIMSSLTRQSLQAPSVPFPTALLSVAHTAAHCSIPGQLQPGAEPYGEVTKHGRVSVRRAVASEHTQTPVRSECEHDRVSLLSASATTLFPLLQQGSGASAEGAQPTYWTSHMGCQRRTRARAAGVELLLVTLLHSHRRLSHRSATPPAGRLRRQPLSIRQSSTVHIQLL